MRNLNLSGIDLNLLVVLEALLEERHVTRAGRRVGLSQPATTNALNRLREVIGDPLLVRSGNTMQLTERALEIRDRLGPALEMLKDAIDAPADFDPKTSPATIRMATLDSVMLRLLPRLMRVLAEEAPLVDLELHPLGAIPVTTWLKEGQLDLAVGVFRSPSPQLRRESLFSEETACLLRDGHPALERAPRPSDPLPLDVYLAYPHLRISADPRDPGSVARALPDRSEDRRVACRVPDFLPAPFIVEQTDLIAILSKSVAERFAAFLALTTRPNPIELPGQDYELVWSPRLDESPLHGWFRSLVARVAQDD